MAIAYRSVATNNANSSGVTVTKPSGTVDGDLMIAHIGVQGSTADTLSGWSLIRTDTANSCNFSLFSKVALSEGASYAFTSPAGVAISAAIMSFSGAAIASYVGANNGQSNGSSTTATAPTITPIANSMICLFAGQREVATGHSAQAITTSDPGLVEKYEVHAPTNGGDGIGISGAVGIRPQSTATGNGTVTLSAANLNVGQIISLSPGLDVNVSPSLFTMTLNFYNFGIAPLFTISASLVSTLSNIWSNQNKHDSTWTNQNKS